MLHLEQKTAEYQNLPGLILGLDGWVLRSVPKELRESFLMGYRKLLNVTFHPDRTRNESRKLAFQNYLQTVSEAVEYLLAGEMNYEMGIDVVPTRLNPIVQLKRNAEVNAEALQTMAERLAEAGDQIKVVSARAQQQTERAEALQARVDVIEASVFKLRTAMQEFGRQIVYPLHGPEVFLRIQFVDLSLADEALSELVAGRIEGGELVPVRNGFIKLRAESWRIVRAVMPVHLREWVGKREGAGDWIRSQLAIQQLPDVFQFGVPFLSSGLFLLVERADERRLAFITADEQTPRADIIVRDAQKRVKQLELSHKRELARANERYQKLLAKMPPPKRRKA